MSVTDPHGLLAGEPALLWSPANWSEGPVWVPRSQTVRFSDAKNNRILQWDPAADEGRGAGSVYADDVEFTNGRTLGLDGRSVIQCSHGRRAVEQDVDGAVTTIVDRWSDGEREGIRFNSPNDVVVDSQGAIWFTDPPYGILPGTTEGREAEPDYDGNYLFRFADGVAVPMVTDLVYPNGLAFSPDESILYIADTGAEGHLLYAWEGGVTRLFKDIPQGASDGFRVDVDGRIWTSAGNHVVVYSPDGTELLDVEFPERVSNLCFGGPDGTVLYITASSSLHRLPTTTRDTAQHF